MKRMCWSYRSRSKVWSWIAQMSLIAFVIYVLKIRWIVSLLTPKVLLENLSWNWFIPMFVVQWKLPHWVVNVTLSVSSIAIVVLLVLASWKLSRKFLDKFRQFCIDEDVPKTFASMTLRSDGCKEFDNEAFDEFCFSQLIKREMISPYSPHQNGVAERRW